MRTSLQWLRGSIALASIALVAGIPLVHAAGKTEAHRYSIYGSLDVVAAEKSTASAPLSLGGRLSAAATEANLQSGGDFVVMAKLAESPLGCGGSDAIFANGFDP